MPIIQYRRPDAEAVQRLIQSGIHPVIARILAGRGVAEPESVALLLRALEQPGSMRDLEKAAHLVAECVLKQKNLFVIGDYDVDGGTATALLMDFLTQCGARVDFLIPNRVTEGYGLSPALVERAAAHQADCLITVDNGISAFAGVEAAKARGMMVIVTDHHLPGQGIPPADAVVNPNQPGCRFPWKSTCGVGVAFYLAAAIKKVLIAAGHPPVHGLDLGQFLDLVALGTVADVVPLEKNNRIFIRAGLKRLRQGTARTGLLALMRVSGISPATVQAEDLGFRLGPRINAAGRLEDMRVGVRLLLTRDAEEADTLAKKLHSLNGERQQIEAEMLEQALERAQQLLPEFAEGLPHPLTDEDAQAVQAPRILCLQDPQGHEGVVGLVAGRIKERTGLPTLVFAPGADAGVLKGSARSIPNVHIRDFLAEMDAQHPGLILGFGGHAMAAGLTVRTQDFDRFAQIAQALALQRIPFDALAHRVWVDGEIEADYCTLDLAQEIEAFGPYGNQFPAPLFIGTFRLLKSQRIGKDGQTLKMSVALDGAGRTGQPLQAIQFKRGEVPDPEPGDICRFLYTLSVNRFRGEESLQCIVQQVMEPVSTAVV
ncbi:single-stranded-DNA-specific exonuclease RecJ [Acidithiobacillus thiooxidans]|uniref:Single-stranded-DNA-specific exonuclease RecJ n=1 Tax=Acidithiobacillus thiooxidans ATCC 19377 TaxID=637390 RepID=A0A543Q1T7_ACITH|nr:single-stranded-DNA-specific exonuclease RecJ [Acidithiobacillus thiooxidans]MDX5935565.1 single-stranded-DNA-specific exonuclease RecJ [Acidithiobacillus thiooxidans]TQN50292.1 Single-stranded-DNA-specific exonuclease RecJ [Acidithiobacillus thiooxidans ATCC 19377]